MNSQQSKTGRPGDERPEKGARLPVKPLGNLISTMYVQCSKIQSYYLFTLEAAPVKKDFMHQTMCERGPAKRFQIVLLRFIRLIRFDSIR
jgi:hypothetical protein